MSIFLLFFSAKMSILGSKYLGRWKSSEIFTFGVVYQYLRFFRWVHDLPFFNRFAPNLLKFGFVHYSCTYSLCLDQVRFYIFRILRHFWRISENPFSRLWKKSNWKKRTASSVIEKLFGDNIFEQIRCKIQQKNVKLYLAIFLSQKLVKIAILDAKKQIRNRRVKEIAIFCLIQRFRAVFFFLPRYWDFSANVDYTLT